MANFLSATANFEDFINMSSAEINGHVQKNNESVLKKAFNFSIFYYKHESVVF